jgi:hypothetical protein
MSFVTKTATANQRGKSVWIYPSDAGRTALGEEVAARQRRQQRRYSEIEFREWARV